MRSSPLPLEVGGPSTRGVQSIPSCFSLRWHNKSWDYADDVLVCSSGSAWKLPKKIVLRETSTLPKFPACASGYTRTSQGINLGIQIEWKRYWKKGHDHGHRPWDHLRTHIIAQPGRWDINETTSPSVKYHQKWDNRLSHAVQSKQMASLPQCQRTLELKE